MGLSTGYNGFTGDMIAELINFYKEHGVFVNEVYDYEDCIVFKNTYLNDPSANYVLALNRFNHEKIKDLFLKHKISPARIATVNSEFEKELLELSYKHEETESMMFLDNLSRLQSLCNRLKSASDCEMIKVTTDKHFEIAKEVSNKGYLIDAPENPYAIFDDASYCDFLKKKITAQTKETVVSFVFQDKKTKEHFATIEASIGDGMAYIASLTIIPKRRFSKAISCLTLFFDFLIKQKVKNVVCKTITGGYPEKLYYKLGFEKAFTISKFLAIIKT